MIAAIKLFFNANMWYLIAGAAALALLTAAGFKIHHNGYVKGEQHERTAWEDKVKVQQSRAARAQIELEQNNRYLARLAETAITNRQKVITHERTLATTDSTAMRSELHTVVDLVRDTANTCDPIVSVANKCIDTAAETRSYAVGAFEAADANADQVDALLAWIETACKTWNKENHVTGDCPDTGAEVRIKAKATAAAKEP